MNDGTALDYKAIQLPRNDGYKPNSCQCSTKQLGSNGRFMFPNVSIPMSQVLDLVGSLLQFPFPTICRHAVAGDLLDLLERNGLNGETFDDLCGFVVGAHDEEALVALAELKREQV